MLRTGKKESKKVSRFSVEQPLPFKRGKKNMSNSVNKVILLGRVGKPPEVRSIDNGAKVASFSMATSESYKDKKTGEKKETTEWSNIVAWRGLAEITEKYVNKGDLIYVEGKLRTRSWEKDGVTRYTTEIVADNIVLLGGKGRISESAEYPGAGSDVSDGEDGLPF